MDGLHGGHDPQFSGTVPVLGVQQLDVLEAVGQGGRGAGRRRRNHLLQDIQHFPVGPVPDGMHRQGDAGGEVILAFHLIRPSDLGHMRVWLRREIEKQSATVD